jgi:Cdc6-like AAA superfamily ATPase
MSNPSYTGMDVTLPNPNDIDTFVHPPDVATIATVADGGSTGSDASSDTTGTGTSVSDNDDVDEPYNDPTMTLTERRAFNIERNHKLLSSLGMLNNETMVKGGGRHKIKQSRKYSSCNNTEPVDGVPSSTQETTTTTMIRGMIIPSCWSMDPLQRQRPQQQPRPKLPEPTPSQSVTSVASSLLLQLQRRYPHRSTQVRKLYSLISVPIHSIQHTTADNTGNAPHLPFVPPPILVTGPAGCGKTSIVRDVVKLIASSSVRPELLVLHAYIDCTTLDHIHIEDFITAAYTQWYQQVPKRETSSSSSQQKHHPPSKTRVQISSLSRIKNYNQADEAPKRISRNRQAKATTVSSSTSLKISNNQQQYLSVKENQGQEMESSSMSQPSSVLTAIWTFGRSLQRFLDRIHRDHPKITVVPLILIVDHAEVLLNMGTTYSKSSPGDRVNFLVQLMLLPRALNLNLTLIFISKNILLEHTGMSLEHNAPYELFPHVSYILTTYCFAKRQL